jgi:hypothetical protein
LFAARPILSQVYLRICRIIHKGVAHNLFEKEKNVKSCEKAFETKRKKVKKKLRNRLKLWLVACLST